MYVKKKGLEIKLRSRDIWEMKPVKQRGINLSSKNSRMS